MTPLQKPGFYKVEWDNVPLLAKNRLISGNTLQKSLVFGLFAPPTNGQDLFAVESPDEI